MCWGTGTLAPAASTVLTAVPSLETRFNPALEHSVKKKIIKKSKRESSHSKPQTMSQIIPRSAEVLPLSPHDSVEGERGSKHDFPHPSSSHS